MPTKNVTDEDKPIYNKKTIEKLHQVLNDKIAEVKRLQQEGKIRIRRRYSRFNVKTGDLRIVLGQRERTAQRHMARVRGKLGKKKDMIVTVIEFCNITGLDVWTMQTALSLCT